MLFTRTIRRTMVCGLAMVLCMMIALLLSAVYSHLSYRHIIHRLRFAFEECPQRLELVASLIRLQGPLLVDPVDREKQQQHRNFHLTRPEFLRILQEAKNETDIFLSRLERLPIDPELSRKHLDESAKSFGRDKAVLIAVTLRSLEQLSAKVEDPALESKKKRKALLDLEAQVSQLPLIAQGIPDYQRGIKDALTDAQAVTQRGLWLDIGSGVIAVIFFLGLIVYGYIWVFSPLRKLHRGALRVAQGDFNYRLEFTRQDEMKELADAFNSMTGRFQEIRGDLDRQVCERIKQLIRSERLAGIGFLAAGVAHEINNPLSAIAMAAESLVDRQTGLEGSDPEEAEIARQYLQMIEREAFRCQRITRKLLDFARGNGDTCAFHDLTAIVNDVLGVVRHMSRYSDRTVRFSRTSPCLLEINGPEIQQVVMNLVSNGLEAMDAGGTLTIEISEQTDQATLSVSDDGCGMTPQVIENLFEPFFTQRRNGRGTGLGLSISHRIVTDHGGTIEVESPGPGHGSVFRVRLPKRAVKRRAAA